MGSEKLADDIRNEIENRRVLGQELQKMFRLRESKLKNAVLTEINEEANARKVVSGEVTRLAEGLKDLRAMFEDEYHRIDARMLKVTVNMKAAMQECDNALNSMRLMRDRADAQLKRDLQHEIADLRKIVDDKGLQDDAIQNAKLISLAAEMKQVRELLDLTEGTIHNLMKEGHATNAQLISAESQEYKQKLSEVSQALAEQMWDNRNRIAENRNELAAEADRRDKAFAQLR